MTLAGFGASDKFKNHCSSQALKNTDWGINDRYVQLKIYEL